jgi:hypothetical protein
VAGAVSVRVERLNAIAVVSCASSDDGGGEITIARLNLRRLRRLTAEMSEAVALLERLEKKGNDGGSAGSS